MTEEIGVPIARPPLSASSVSTSKNTSLTTAARALADASKSDNTIKAHRVAVRHWKDSGRPQVADWLAPMFEGGR